jgi:CBS domain-containing protein
MRKVRDIMTNNPVTLSKDTPVVEAARKMKQQDIGDIVVTDNGSMCGIVTDRDIVIRAIADAKDPKSTRLGDICTKNLVTVAPDEDVDRAVELMRSHSIRRLPVLENGRPVGIVSLGDLAMERDPQSVLGQVSTAAPQH